MKKLEVNDPGNQYGYPYMWGTAHYANPNSAADEYLVPSVKQDLAIYPPKNVMEKLFTVEELPAAIARLTTRLWTKLKTNT